MDEQLLHHIWKFQKFDCQQLTLTDGTPMHVFHTGVHNHDSGPDFEGARIKINDLEWVGHVEIHIKSSDWMRHQHQHDPAYENVVLHVVWKHDRPIVVNNEVLPTLELQHLVNPLLLNKYSKQLSSPKTIPCANQLYSVSAITKTGMMHRTLVERIEEKAQNIADEINTTSGDWEHITYVTLATHFGFGTNNHAFNHLVSQLPYRILKKVLHDLRQTEAILFGMAGFLNGPLKDPYHQDLAKEFNFLTKKHQLPEPLKTVQWKFGKLRPANFPTLRIAQLASLLHQTSRLFSFLIETVDMDVLRKSLQPTPSKYWQTHYSFGFKRTNRAKRMGRISIETLLINVISPLLAAYSHYRGETQYMDRAILLLESLKAENNRITRKWEKLNMKPQNAFDSQALIQLFKKYCQHKRCIHCNIGVEILSE